MTIDARALAKASGAAQRAYPFVAQLVAAAVLFAIVWGVLLWAIVTA